MARKNLTQVEQAELLQIAEAQGLSVVANKGFIKVFGTGQHRPPALGIPTTKLVTRVELVGFEHPIAVAHPKPPAKTVTQVLDFSKPRECVLEDFQILCEHIKHKAAVVEAAIRQAIEEGIAQDIVNATSFEVIAGEEPEEGVEFKVVAGEEPEAGVEFKVVAGEEPELSRAEHLASLGDPCDGNDDIIGSLDDIAAIADDAE